MRMFFHLLHFIKTSLPSHPSPLSTIHSIQHTSLAQFYSIYFIAHDLKYFYMIKFSFSFYVSLSLSLHARWENENFATFMALRLNGRRILCSLSEWEWRQTKNNKFIKFHHFVNFKWAWHDYAQKITFKRCNMMVGNMGIFHSQFLWQKKSHLMLNFHNHLNKRVKWKNKRKKC